jgi:hypothetical protein
MIFTIKCILLQAESGGVIRIEDSEWYSTSDIFQGNYAGFGGVASSSSFITISLENSTITKNRAFAGGALYISNGENFRFFGVDAAENTALGSGGVVVAQSSSGIISNCNFQSNSAKMLGGALFFFEIEDTTTISAASSILLTGSSFVDNIAGSIGGSISVRNFNELVIFESVFVRNSAQYGGGISSTNTKTTISSSNFTLNNATYGGGGIFWEYQSTYKQVHYIYVNKL